MPFAAILFDFFGTLVGYRVGATGEGFQRSHQWLAQAGGPRSYAEFLDSWAAVSSRFDEAAEKSGDEYPMKALVASFLESHRVGAHRTAEFIETFIAEWNEGVVYEDPIHSAIRQLSGNFGLGIVTNTHLESLVPAHLERMGVRHCFSEVITSCGHGKRKPHPAIFQHALARMGASPESTLVIGDSLEADFHGARRAGMTALLIDASGDSGLPAADRITSVAELPAWLAHHKSRSSPLP